MLPSNLILRVSGPLVNGVRSLRTSVNGLFRLSESYSNEGSSEQTNQQSNTVSDDEYERMVKSKILTASLKYVNELGWCKGAVIAGAESIGYPGVIHGMFPNPGAELVHHFQATCNARLLEILENQVQAIAEGRTKRITPEKQVQNALERRLKMVIPYKKNWPQALAVASLPPSIPNSITNFCELVDDVCYYAGDRSVDFSWYTRRATIAAIYKSTELYMLQDNSEEHKDTWEFLDKRIQQASMINEIPSLTNDTANSFADVAVAIYVTTRNMLGINEQGRKMEEKRIDENNSMS